MPRKTDSNNPADWLWIAESDLSVIRLALAPEVGFTDRYPGFDLDDPDWPALRAQVKQVEALLAAVRANLSDG